MSIGIMFKFNQLKMKLLIKWKKIYSQSLMTRNGHLKLNAMLQST